MFAWLLEFWKRIDFFTYLFVARKYNCVKFGWWKKKHIVCQLLLGRQHCVLFRDMSFVNGKRIFGFWEKNSRTKEAAVEIYFSDPFNCLECGFWLRIDLHGRIYHVRLVQMVLHMKILVESMTLKKRNLFIIGKCSGE